MNAIDNTPNQHSATSLDPHDEPVQIRNLLIVTLLLTIFHFGLYHAVAMERMISGASFEMQRVDSAINGTQAPKESSDLKLFLKEKLLTFPIIIIVDRTKNPTFYHSTEIPMSLRALNSFAAAIILHMFGLLVVQLLPESHRMRRFFEGRGLREKGALPKHLDKVGIFKMARTFEKAEKTRYGLIFIIAFFHFWLGTAANMLAIGSRINPTPGGSSKLTLPLTIMRLPLTPLLVDPSFWEKRYNNQAVPGILAFANSLLFALGALILAKICTRR